MFIYGGFKTTMITGIGTDIAELARFQQMDLDRLATRILTKQEQQQIPTSERRKLEFLAGRFAAKEAIAKAFGTGIGAFFSFRDAAIIPDDTGKPEVHLSSALQRKLPNADTIRVHLSISHSGQHVIAMVVIEQTT